MRVRQLDDKLVTLLSEADHPEIVSVTALAAPTRDGQPPDPRHTRVKLVFASGATAFIMVRSITGPDIAPHPPFELPPEMI